MGTKKNRARVRARARMEQPPVEQPPGFIEPPFFDPSPVVEEEGRGYICADIPELDGGTVAALEPQVFTECTRDDVAWIPPEIFQAFRSEYLSGLSFEALGGLGVEQFHNLPVNAVSGLTSENLGGLSAPVVFELMPEHLEALNTEEFHQSSAAGMVFTNLNPDEIGTGWTLDKINSANHESPPESQKRQYIRERLYFNLLKNKEVRILAIAY
ncbi:MAG: hypothetical protein GY862_08190, partial [Gammaproteobacteria bacterium]|nr:hypothetical protein [Gammaproteobacteria bacterium]